MDRKVYLTGLIISCPLNKALNDCIFNKCRDISVLKLIKKIDRLSEEEVILMANKHKICFKNRKMAMIESNAIAENRIKETCFKQ